MNGGILPAGRVSGAINDLIRVAEFIPALVEEAVTILEALQQRVVRPVQTEHPSETRV